jgi:hypothetical protein
MARPEVSAKKRNHAATLQQIKVRRTCTAGSGLGYNESEGQRKKDRQRPENNKGIHKQAIDLVTAPASTATINLAAHLKGIHELISDVSFQPQQPVRSAAVALETWSLLGKRTDMIPDTVTLIIWLIAGVAGGSAVGDLLKGFDLGLLRNVVAGGVGGVVGAKILELLIPALRGLDVVPVVGQAIVAAASGAAFTVVVSAVGPWRRR